MQCGGFTNVYIDIVGKCNARCVWCERGSRNIGLLPPPLANDAPKFMPVDVFGEVLDHLLSKNIMHKQAQLLLHNWGEPLIHPQIHEIFKIIKDNSYFEGSIAFSSNGSRCLELDPHVMPDISWVTFSLPGFSQASYDFAHKFDFQKIIRNIHNMAKDLEKFNPRLKHITYHMYKHNLSEMYLAKAFSEKIGFVFSPVLAYFNSRTHTYDYINGTMSDEMLAIAKKSIFLADYDAISLLRPDNHVCSQFKLLVISHDAQLNVGCCARLDQADDCRLGDIRTLSFEEINTIRRQSKACSDCIKYGLDFSAEYYGSETRVALCNQLRKRWEGKYVRKHSNTSL